MSATASLPVKARELHNPPCDSTHWNDFVFRDDDVVIATWSKSGTTWTQQIVAQLIFEGDPEVYGQTLSPWIDCAGVPENRELALAQSHRRFLKSHLPLDALTFSPRARYIYIGRDARDVFWSWHHHHAIMTPFVLDLVGQHCDRPFTAPNPDIRADFHHWLDNDAAPQSSFWQNVQSWWDFRHLPNIKLLHFAAMKADPAGSIRQIADFLDIPLNDALLERVLRHSSFDHMKQLAARQPMMDMMFEGGGGNFINKGTNGRWRDVLSDDEIAKCDRIAAQRLTPECAHWLRTGEAPD
jgi:aryl sulfotransferase